MVRTRRISLGAIALWLAIGTTSSLRAQTAAEAEVPPEQSPEAEPSEGEDTPPDDSSPPSSEGEPGSEPEAEPEAPEASAQAPDSSPPADAPAEPDIAPQGPSEAGDASTEFEADGAAGVSLEAETSEGAASDAEIEEIVVTGSRLKRSSFAASAPVQIIDRTQLEFSGAQNLEDLLQNLTAAVGSGYRGGGGGAGTVQVNLRGLGSGATLVLINGRRAVQSGAGVTEPFVDISTIPLTAVERIEILKGGASAIYGSDAIAGVVNIITRTDWHGARAQVDGRTTDNLDQREGTASVAFGANTDSVRVTGALNYYRRNQLLANKRGFTNEEGPPGGLGGDWSTRGQPGTFLAPGLMPDPACLDDETRPEGSEVRSLEPYGDLCYFQFRNFRGLTDNLERTAGYMHGEVDVTLHTQLFAEFNAAKTRTDSIGSPSYSFNVRPTVPADHVDNPWGVPAAFAGRPLGAEAGGAISETDDDTLRTAFGLRGDLEGAGANTLLEDWKWELYATFGVSRYHRFLPDTVLPDFEAALDSCSDRSDLSGCYNPFYSAVLGTGTPRSQSVIESFQGGLMGITDQHLQTYNAGLSGSVLELPGGDLGFAVGGEYRHELRTSQLDHNTNNFELLFFHGDEDGYAERDVLGGYLEMLWPMLDGLEVQTAGRLEHYDDAGSTGNPTIGLVLTPAQLLNNNEPTLRRLQLRGHLSRAFRAPHLFQTFNGSTTVPGAFLPPGQAVPIFAPVRRVGNPDLEPEIALAASAGASWTPNKTVHLELDFWHYDYQKRISSQSATRLYNDTVDELMNDPTYDDPRVEVDDMFAPQRITVTYINLPGSVITQGLDFLAMFNFELDGAGALRGGVNGTYTFTYQLDREHVPNFTLDGGTPTDPNDDTNFEPPFCDGDTCNVVGQLNGDTVAAAVPELRFNIPVTWVIDEHALGLVAHFMSSLEDWSPSRFNQETMRPYTTVGSYFTLDLSYAYTLRDVVGSSTNFRLGVYNLLEQEPPFADLLDSYAPLHDPRGRVIYGSIIQDF
ncbi:MAG: TonB-dependent receptor [Myxococcales bacterium]|nr:TonB-dependent receptor [Myxococcales bacterium]